jgi:hypothetical protein
VRIDAEQISADAPVGGGDNKARGMDVLVERGLVSIRKPDRVGDTAYRRLLSGREMPAVTGPRAMIGGEGFELGSRDVGWSVARIDADDHDLEITVGVEREPIERGKEVVESQPAQCLAPRII